MVERELGQLRDRMPGRVLRKLRVEVCRYEAEVSRRDLPFARMAGGIAERFDLLEVGDLSHVDLGGEVLSDRLLERLAALEVAAGQRPSAKKRLSRPLPEERLQCAGADLEHHREGDMGRIGRLTHRF